MYLYCENGEYCRSRLDFILLDWNAERFYFLHFLFCLVIEGVNAEGGLSCFPLTCIAWLHPVFPFLAVIRLSFDGGKEGRVQRGKERNKLGLGEIKILF